MMDYLQKQLLIGLPETGKTTFLAALWHVVESEELLNCLRLQEVHGDRTYLNRIRNDWLACRPIGRTVITGEHLVSMKLTDPNSARTTEVFFPDMSGESFRLQWKERSWTKKYDQLARDAAGVLLFVHPRKVREPTRIDAAEMLVAALGAEEADEITTQPEGTVWDADLAPTQVQLVDLLQFLMFEAVSHVPLRVAVIISAWDLVANEKRTPQEWLARRLPLLDQYFMGNPELFTVRIYGLSAQGGDLQKDASRLQDKHKHSERILIVGPDCMAHDITAPVRWLMA